MAVASCQQGMLATVVSAQKSCLRPRHSFHKLRFFNLHLQFDGLRSTCNFSPTGAVAVRQQRRRNLNVVSQDLNVFKAIGKAVKIGNDVLDAGTNLVPDSIPRPVARVGIGVMCVLSIAFFLNSILSTISLILGVGGLSLLAYLYLNKDERSSGTGDESEKSLEEARRIMEKYK